MDIIWAPWRLSYVSSASEKASRACFICKAIESEPSADRENLLLHRGAKAVVILNRFPYNTGHVMVCPSRHTGDFLSLLPEELAEIDELIKRSIRAIKRAFNPHGFNIGLNLGKVSGGSVDTHLHYHIVPRWEGDTNFMPVVAKVKVIPQALQETYELLKKCWE